MGLSIITPHYNNFKGIKNIYDCLKNQNSSAWEWIIVDDFSDVSTIKLLKNLSNTINIPVKVIFNTSKSNASVCRNIGIENSIFSNLVFLDSDDIILDNFITNRQVKVEKFIVFKNYKIENEKGEQFLVNVVEKDPLKSYLSALFIWQTTCVLWNKNFLNKIGRFDSKLDRLQDVELSIRALLESDNCNFIDNTYDFIYYVKPIRLIPNIVKNSCTSVKYMILKFLNNYSLDIYKKSLKSYYYACIKTLHRTKLKTDIVYVKHCLGFFYKMKIINFIQYTIGKILLTFYKYQLISDSLFLKINRYYFK